MDMYRILESFDAVNSRATVSEGEVKRAMHADADKMSRAEFVDKYGAENGEFWDNVRGDDEEQLDEGPYTRLNTYRIKGQDMIDYLANEGGAQVEMVGDEVGILTVDIISFPELEI